MRDDLVSQGTGILENVIKYQVGKHIEIKQLRHKKVTVLRREKLEGQYRLGIYLS